METEYFDFDLLEVKRGDIGGADHGSFSGLASPFNGEPDTYGDVIAQGAFTKSLAAHRTKGTAPVMLWAHDPAAVIGKWTSLRETGSGLEVKGKLTLAVAKAAEAWALIKDHAVSGLSIGYRTVRADKGENNTRILRAVDLLEISIVGMPAAGAARIVAAKAMLARGECPQRADLERLLRAAGMTKSQALRAAPAVRQALDPEAADLNALAEAIARAHAALR